MDQQPSISNLAVIARTGKDWATWLLLLDEAGAAKLDHKSIVKLLGTRHGLGPWWRQMVAVEYERARGLRLRNQTATGFSVSISRTLHAARPAVFAAAADARKRRHWFPPGRMKLSSAKEYSALRAVWNGTARLEITFTEKPGGMTLLVVTVTRLAAKEEVERERAAWKNAIAKLETMLKR